MILIVVLYALFASTFSLGKELLQYTQPIFLVGIRMSIAGLLLLAFQYFYKHTTFRFEKKHLLLYLQAMLFTTYAPYIFRFWGLKHMPSSKAALLYSLSPFLTYVFSYFLCGEKVTPKKVIGLLIGFFGLMPVLIAPAPKEDLVGGISVFSWAELSIIFSVTLLSYGWIVMRKLIKDNHYPPTMVNGISMFSGGILALLTSFLFEPSDKITEIIPFFSILAVIILVSNLICHNLYAGLLKKYSPTFLSFAGFLSPLFAAFYGWVFLSEKISWEFAVSVGCVIVGLAVFYQDELHEQRQQANDDEELVHIEGS